MGEGVFVFLNDLHFPPISCRCHVGTNLSRASNCLPIGSFTHIWWHVGALSTIQNNRQRAILG